MELDYEVTELNRRLANLIRLGTVLAVNTDAVHGRAQVSLGALTTAWLPLLSLRAGLDQHHWLPDVGEQVLVLSPSGDLNQGVVIPAIAQQRFTKPDLGQGIHHTRYGDGTTLEYDRNAHRLAITLAPGGTAHITAPGGIEVEGTVRISGNVEVEGEVQDHTGTLDALRQDHINHGH